MMRRILPLAVFLLGCACLTDAHANGKVKLQAVKAQVEELRSQTASASQKPNTALASRTTFLLTTAPLGNALLPDQRLCGLDLGREVGEAADFWWE
jgi:hypothetical protein